jgi:hypothetical protein
LVSASTGTGTAPGLTTRGRGTDDLVGQVRGVDGADDKSSAQ